MIEAGHFAAFLALALSLAQGVFGLRGERRLAGMTAIAAFGLMGFSFLTLINAFVTSDFSVALVASNSHTLKPMAYKIAGAWGNHEGSMALWCLVTLGFGAAAAGLMRTERPLFEARALGIQGLLSLGALAYLLFASSPYLRLDPAPFQGAGLNPLLQDPALALHPPMLYLGYVGYSFVFALAAAGLMESRIDRVWAKEARIWSLAAFAPLTLGIALGSYWAYYELGWGGFLGSGGECIADALADRRGAVAFGARDGKARRLCGLDSAAGCAGFPVLYPWRVSRALRCADIGTCVCR